jgi:uncharacterized protein
MATAVMRWTRGAAACVALFALAPMIAAAWPALNALFDIVPPAFARMQQDRLRIVSSVDGKEHEFTIEVAATEKEKALGLMFRTGLHDDQGMLFPYAVERQLEMWMRNTYIPLDMLFIRADGVITRIEKSAEPLSDRVISSESPVLAVLEIPGGAADRLGIRAGDKVNYKIFSTS